MGLGVTGTPSGTESLRIMLTSAPLSIMAVTLWLFTSMPACIAAALLVELVLVVAHMRGHWASGMSGGESGWWDPVSGIW